VSIAEGAWLASANYLGYLLGAVSVVAVRIRAARAIRGGLVTIGLATLGWLQDSFAIWIALRALAGIASAWVLICVSAWCLERLEARAPAPARQHGVRRGRGRHRPSRERRVWRSCASTRARPECGSCSESSRWFCRSRSGRYSAPRIVSRSDAHRAERSRGIANRSVSPSVTGPLASVHHSCDLPSGHGQAGGKDPRSLACPGRLFRRGGRASTLLTTVVRRLVTNRRLWIASHLVHGRSVSPCPSIWPGIVRRCSPHSAWAVRHERHDEVARDPQTTVGDETSNDGRQQGDATAAAPNIGQDRPKTAGSLTACLP